MFYNIFSRIAALTMITVMGFTHCPVSTAPEEISVVKFIPEDPELRTEVPIYVNGDVKLDSAEMIIDYFDDFPAAYEAFAEAGGEVLITDDFSRTVKKLYNRKASDKATGVYFRDDNGRPVIVYNNETLFVNGSLDCLFACDTIVHEIGHFVDLYMLGGSTKTEEFQYLFDTYAKDYQPNCSVIEGYAASDVREMFAVVFSDMTTSGEYWVEENVPEEVREYMQEAINFAKGI